MDWCLGLSSVAGLSQYFIDVLDVWMSYISHIIHIISHTIHITIKHTCPRRYAAAAAKSLQLCPTMCDPIDSSPPGSPIPGILQARTLEWVAKLKQSALNMNSSFHLSQSLAACILPSVWILTTIGTNIGGIITHLFFCVSLISLNIMSSRFTYVVSCVRISFLFKAKYFLIISIFWLL